MAHLTDTFIKQVKVKPKAFVVSDGQNLILTVKPNGKKYWSMTYLWAGKQTSISLGVYPVVTLEAARKKRNAFKEKIDQGVNPREVRFEQQRERNASMKFKEFFKVWLAKRKSHILPASRNQIIRAFELHIFPTLGNLEMRALRHKDVLNVLEKMEERGIRNTARRTKGFLEALWNYAVLDEVVKFNVVSVLKGELQKLPKTVSRPAITKPNEYAQLLRDIYSLEGREGVGRRYILRQNHLSARLANLVMLRPSNVVSAEWSEIDFENKEWLIPAGKLKMEIEHLVPLSRQALEILQELKDMNLDNRWVFPGRIKGHHLTESALYNLITKRLPYRDKHCPHGFRASARTMCAERLKYQDHILEHMLAHVVKWPNGTAYDRSSFLEERKEYMQGWADYCDQLREGGTVLKFPVPQSVSLASN